jgi:hypothetical protein
MRKPSPGSLTAVLASLALYAPAVLGLSIFFERDVNNYWRPQIEWALKTLASGQSIAWNPDLSFGIPMLSDPSFQFFYPPTWVLLFVSPSWAYTFIVVLHAWWAGLGLSRLLQKTGLSEGAPIGVLALVLAGPFVSMANLWHHYCGAAWIPWVLLAARRAFEPEGAWRPLALAAGFQALAGSAESLMMSTAAAILLNLRSGLSVGALSTFARALLVGGLIGCVQWIPTLYNFGESARRDFSADQKLSWSVSPRSLPELVIPGRPAARQITLENVNIPPDFFDQRFITQQYLGSSTLVLVLVGAWFERRIFLLLLVALLLSVGKYWGGDISPVLSALFPFRYPSKLLALVSLFWAFLTAAGAARFLRHAPSTSRRFPAVECAIVMACLLWPVVTNDWSARLLRALAFAVAPILVVAFRGRWMKIVLPMVIACDLLPQSRAINRLAPPELGRYRPAVVPALLRLDPHPRVFIAHPGETWMQADLNALGRGSNEDYAIAMSETLFPPHGMRYGIGYGYHIDFTGLGSAQSQRFENAGKKTFQANLHRFLDMGAITAVVSTGNTLPLGPLPGALEFPTRMSRPVRIDPWNRTSRVSVPRLALSAPSIEAGLTRFVQPDFQPTENSLIMAGPALSGPLGPGVARIVRDETTQVEIDATMEHAGYLVLRDSFRTGWTARVNDSETPIELADFLFRAVRLPAGRSLVVFSYRTPGLRLGALLTLAALVSLLPLRVRR